MRLKQLLPQSLASRTNAVLLTLIIAAQLLASFIWYQQSEQHETRKLASVADSIASSAASTISYFTALPRDYRHLVLKQIRNIGGTRFFVSLNHHNLTITPLPDSKRKWIALNKIKTVLRRELGEELPVTVNFTSRNNLRVFNAGIKFDDLPLTWAHHSLSFGAIDAPILVIQAELTPSQWFYMATVLPFPLSGLHPIIDSKQLFLMALSAILLLSCTFLLIRTELRPIRQLARAATMMSANLSVPQVKEEGCIETRAAVRAFNKMNLRVKSYIHEREMLFGAISHDLKTPLACLKLRSEMLPDEATRLRFTSLLGEIDLMVKGALQCIRDTSIYEEIEAIDIHALLTESAELYNQSETKVTVCGRQTYPFFGKPLAIKRVIQNLVDNGIKYGDYLQITLNDAPEQLSLIFVDSGSGIDKAILERVFEPYFRADGDGPQGSGLGLTIARSIVRAHNGDIRLENRSDRSGLRVNLMLRRD